VKNLKLSIAMATFNGEQFLPQQLNSFLNQERKPDELVVCDDCSTDNTYKILQNFRKTCGFYVKIIKNVEKLGVGKNFEEATKNCTGDIILFSDQDDVWLPNKIKLIENYFIINNQIDYLISNAEIVDSKLNSLKYTLWQQRKFNNHLQKKYELGNEFYVMIRRDITTGMVTALRKTIITKFNPIPPNISHDFWYLPLAAALGKRGGLIKLPIVKYRQHHLQLYGASKKNLQIKLNNLSCSTSNILNTKIHILSNYLMFLSKQPMINNKILQEINTLLSHYNKKLKIYNLPRYRRIFYILIEVINFNYLRFSNINNIIFDILKNKITGNDF
jgi:glycosyltransferase involved in cell wall biosynthesis